MKIVLLAGASASGKSTLARALGGDIFSTSAYLKGEWPGCTADELYNFGQVLDRDNPTWVRDRVRAGGVVDAIRSPNQARQFSYGEVVTVNVTCDDLSARHRARGTQTPEHYAFQFLDPHFVWDSSKLGLGQAVACINQLRGSGYADVVLGAQYGSEGKGKLCALLANNYDILVRSGGPNAGHWVRDEHYEFCFHHVPSGSLANPKATVVIAAGATLGQGFTDEVERTGVGRRLIIDRNAVFITPGDCEREKTLVGRVGSTAQGVGAAQSRRIGRGREFQVEGPLDSPIFKGQAAYTPDLLHRDMSSGERVLIEGTQGSGLSLYHGPYPFVTSRDTNVGGLLAETGIAASWVRDIWLVVRSFPIRTGGNSGPISGELTWEEVAARTGHAPELLKVRELTSTTKRLRRVGEFDPVQFAQACAVNRPTRLFLTFADYLSPEAAGVRDWSKLPPEVLSFVGNLESIAGCPCVGASTGRMQSEVAWRPGYEP